ncbi:MAG: aminomethyl-transferring glycine dehydrogenase [Bacteroidetes bacterium]|nr:aminomethyl-transferring glycine dehydrogenase [Bacteroidota bacterium]
MTTEKFSHRHNGPRVQEIDEMLKKIGVASVDELIDQTIPESIRLDKPMNLHEGISEYEYLKKIKKIASKNKLFKTYIGLGYYDTITPSVILRNVLENPSWYTSYTPYQAEISQGRLEALLNFQTAIMELTGMEIANSSLLDEGTSAAEAVLMMYRKRARFFVKNNGKKLFVDKNIFSQTLDVIKTRTSPFGIELVIGDFKKFEADDKVFGAVIQYPAANGEIVDYEDFVSKIHENDGLVTVAADILSLVMLTPPAEWGADVVVGNTQRLGLPMFYGGPHAGYFATRQKFVRNMPGRIIGISVDSNGDQVLRMALQTREQHIKREKATSNICTSQALMATMAGLYVSYHGKDGMKRIANKIHSYAGTLNDELSKLDYNQEIENYFDTIQIRLPENISKKDIEKLALEREINFNYIDDKTIGISVDETTNVEDINLIIEIFAIAKNKPANKIKDINNNVYFDKKFVRQSTFLEENVFNTFHSETEMMRYIKKLERKDLSLTHSMTPLGSCTMKLNSANSMLALSWVEFGGIHPFVPENQALGYKELVEDLGKDLCVITGFSGVSFQPNSGAAGEYAGLMVIRQYHLDHGDTHRNIVLIPSSAHGTNPASAHMSGSDIVIVDCDEKGNINVEDFKNKAEKYKDNLSAFIVTYPSTHGVFESAIKEMVDITHKNGGLVYMDGANMNGQIGLTSPGFIGADVCHLNLHKTFASPHGGGGPGVGPICVNDKLVDYLPTHPIVKTGGKRGVTAVSSAQYGSAGLLPIPYAYVKMLGYDGLTEATKIAILNTNYIAACLKDAYGVLYTGEKGWCAHEMILDCRTFKHEYGIETGDIARRLMDYGFHAPTLSFPVHETLMIEPTESESKKEIDRFIETMLSIREEIEDIKRGKADAEDNVLINAPHTAEDISVSEWKHSYSRQKACYPLKWIANNKFWPAVSKIDNGYGDRNLLCSSSELEEYK